MATKTAGIPGLAVASVAAGAVLLWSGLRNASVSDTLRGFIRGTPVKSQPSQTHLGAELGAATAQAAAVIAGNIAAGAAPATGPGGGTIVDDARRYLGVPYRWGASSPTGMDCSGFVNWVIGHDLGLPIPGHPDGRYTGHGPVTGEWYVWSGAVTVPPGQAAAGDLVCWPSHMGIYMGSGQMINAPSAGKTVSIAKVWTAPQPLYRRLKAQPRQAVSQATTQQGGPVQYR